MIGQVHSAAGKKYNIVILAGGAGSRMGEASDYIPKALSKLGTSRAIDFVMQRHINVVHKFIIGTGWHADLLTSYVKGNYSKFDLEFSYEHPDDLKNNGVSTTYCLDHCDSRYPTMILFCDLIPISNFFLNHDDMFLVATSKTQGNVGTFRHTFDREAGIIVEQPSPVTVTDNILGVMGNFIFSDTVMLKAAAYNNFYTMQDLTYDIVMPYNDVIPMYGENCAKVFEFGTTEDIKKVRELWERQ